MNIKRLNSRQADFSLQLDQLLAFETTQDEQLEATVAKILADVRVRGDIAVLEYTQRFDRLTAGNVEALEIATSELREAFESLPVEQRIALEQAAERVTAYHKRQLQTSWSYIEEDGTQLGQQITAIERVGLYVPGGKAAYPSSVLMNALPAKVAGVKELIMVVPTPDGVRNQLVFAAAYLVGVDRVFTIGGAQAIAALAYGTATIPRVDKIVGPGNAYVASAKRRVFGVVGIDMVAGPSEILVICDGKTNPDWIAMDLFSQAEHDELAQAILLTPSEDYAEAVRESAKRLLIQMPRREIIQTAMESRGAIIIVRDIEEACEISNRIAPEHLELSVDQPQQWLPKLKHAGAIFMGRFTSEALGDYCAGPNHVLPTSGTARFSSPLGVYDFQKRSSIIQVSEKGAATLGEIAATLAFGEGLQAHAQSALYRKINTPLTT
jgi:histidinol dehydrogenase